MSQCNRINRKSSLGFNSVDSVSCPDLAANLDEVRAGKCQQRKRPGKPQDDFSPLRGSGAKCTRLFGDAHQQRRIAAIKAYEPVFQ